MNRRSQRSTDAKVRELAGKYRVAQIELILSKQATKPLRKVTVQELDEKLGFWINRKKVVSAAGPTVEFSWRCKCEAVTLNGLVVQYVPCAGHGGNDDFAG